MTTITIDTEKLWGIIKVPVLLIVIILLAIGGLVIYNQGQADALAQQQRALTAAQALVTAQPTPAPTPSPYPETVTVTVNAANGPPNNMFPDATDQNGRIYDISNSGSAWQNIVVGATYDIYVTGTRQQYGETIYETGWITYVSQPYGWYGYSETPACGYNGYTCYPYNSYSSTAYWDGQYYYTFQSDGYWHPATSFDVTRGHTIAQGKPPADRIRW